MATMLKRLRRCLIRFDSVQLPQILQKPCTLAWYEAVFLRTHGIAFQKPHSAKYRHHKDSRWPFRRWGWALHRFLLQKHRNFDQESSGTRTSQSHLQALWSYRGLPSAATSNLFGNHWKCPSRMHSSKSCDRWIQQRFPRRRRLHSAFCKGRSHSIHLPVGRQEDSLQHLWLDGKKPLR